MILRRVPSLRLASFSWALRACSCALAYVALSRAFLIWSDVGSGMFCLGLRRADLVPEEGDTEAYTDGNSSQGKAVLFPATRLLLPGQHPPL